MGIEVEWFITNEDKKDLIRNNHEQPLPDAKRNHGKSEGNRPDLINLFPWEADVTRNLLGFYSWYFTLLLEL